MQASASGSEDRNSSPERSPKRRRTYNPHGPRLNGDGHYTASAASTPRHPTSLAFAPRSPVRSWTTPIPNSLQPSVPTPGLPCSTITTSGMPCMAIPAPDSPRFLGESREYMSLMISSSLLYNRARNPYPAAAMASAAERFARVPAFPTIRALDWKMRLNSWPQASKGQAGAEMDPCVTALRRTLSSTL